MTSRQVGILIGLAVLLLISVFVGALSGFISPSELFDDPASGIDMLLKYRLPGVILGIFVGAALAVAGCAFQGILRNPLATPYTLGVAGGANFGAYLVILAIRSAPAGDNVLSLILVPLGAFIGAILTATFVYSLARRRGKLSSYSLILAGVVINFTFASIIMFLYFIAKSTDLFTMVHWSMGSLRVIGYSEIYLVAPVVAICLILLLGSHRSFDLLAFGELTAHSMGLNVERFIQWIFVLVSIMVGVCVAVAGPIGFVGLVIPHILRLAFGGRHAFLLPASMLAGGAFLCFADAIGREVMQPREIPVGILTAIVGGPILAVLLLRGRGYEVGD